MANCPGGEDAMADISKEELNEIVARVTREVLGEVKAHEGAYRVSDLLTHLPEFAGGDVAAWKISYDTSGITSIERRAGVEGQ
jgi:hypothetical protein